MPDPCRDHPQRPARARCATCSRELCDECFRFRLDDAPACARCAYENATRPQRRVSLAVTFVLFSLAGGAWAARHFDLWPEYAVALVVGGVVAVGLAIAFAVSARSAKSAKLDRRDPDDEPKYEEVAADPGNPFRVGMRRVLLAASPKVSGSVTALVVGLSLVAAAVMVPASMKLPRWLEAEIVLGMWWTIVAGTLTILLYRGFRLRDDFVYFLPWQKPSADPNAKEPSKKGSSFSLDGAFDGCGRGGCSFDGCGFDGCGDLEGAGAAIVVVIALVAALAFAWIFVEIALPILFFLMYALLLRAIGRVARDNRGCVGNPSRSLGFGVLWATIYVVPIALVTVLVHFVRHR